MWRIQSNSMGPRNTTRRPIGPVGIGSSQGPACLCFQELYTSLSLRPSFAPKLHTFFTLLPRSEHVQSHALRTPKVRRSVRFSCSTCSTTETWEVVVQVQRCCVDFWPLILRVDFPWSEPQVFWGETWSFFHLIWDNTPTPGCVVLVYII